MSELKGKHSRFSLEFFHLYTDPIESFIRFFYLLLAWFLCFKETYTNSDKSTLYLLGISCCMFIIPVIIDLIYAIYRLPRVLIVNGILMAIYLVFMIWIVCTSVPMVLRHDVGDVILGFKGYVFYKKSTIELLKTQTRIVWIVNLIDSIVMMIMGNPAAGDKVITISPDYSEERVQKFDEGLEVGQEE